MTTEEKIIKAAETVFLKDGYDGARMERIAREAGINKALLHYYFRSKENLFEKIVRSKINDFLPSLGAVIFTDISLVEKVEYFIERYIELLVDKPYLPMFLINTVHRNPDFIAELPREFMQGFLGYFQMEVEKGTVRNIDPKQFILSVMSMCIFPFMAKPVARHMFDMNEEEYKTFLEERKEELKSYVRILLAQ